MFFFRKVLLQTVKQIFMKGNLLQCNRTSPWIWPFESGTIFNFQHDKFWSMIHIWINSERKPDINVETFFADIDYCNIHFKANFFMAESIQVKTKLNNNLESSKIDISCVLLELSEMFCFILSDEPKLRLDTFPCTIILAFRNDGNRLDSFWWIDG